MLTPTPVQANVPAHHSTFHGARRASAEDCAAAVVRGALAGEREVGRACVVLFLPLLPLINASCVASSITAAQVYFPFTDTRPGIFLAQFFPNFVGWMVKKTVG